MSKLDRIVDATREELRGRRRDTPLAELEARIDRSDERPFSEAFHRPGVSIIAEHKRRSPSAGEIRGGASVSEIVSAYERGGAAAISVLTDETNFHGSLADEDLRLLYDEATALDLDCMIEVHDEPDLERALLLDPDVIGINNRNLGDLTVDTRTTPELITDVPAGKTVVAESGYTDPAQVEELERIGVDAVLIGESLMRSGDPEDAVSSLVSDEEKTRVHRVSDER